MSSLSFFVTHMGESESKIFKENDYFTSKD